MPDTQPADTTCLHCQQPIAQRALVPGWQVWRHIATPHGKLYRWCRLFEAEPAGAAE